MGDNCTFTPEIMVKSTYSSHNYLRLRPEQLNGTGDFTVMLAVKNRRRSLISYAQYFASIPSTPYGGKCHFGPGLTGHQIEIICKNWKSQFMLIYRVLQSDRIIKISAASRFQVLKQSTLNQPFKLQI